ncbi:HD domain-containing protein [Synechococcus sp. CS-1325]|uniref:HD domain-containing protein n=1 Tax=unclassified Synechococcus TaxID=2626047 RepID=UPI000DB3F27D|nr:MULTISPECIES: HD domain-containing protein [unclassified Synechococcus]MCT0198864.1 HD domain-containing protein [Synechococcus sp. CS-1325]MCT0214044.1 HD domain-containing protein [Synechococcus sp. CS-1326]MCT0234131.1 HD domain-containing protein [Synechococcus sp. CS-1327]PZV00040.1 MAG: HD family phosphohydrolase [Cyanobium sp.]
MTSRTYHDPLHGAIRLDRALPAEALVMDLIETAPFQRLRRIRQLGPAFLTFHGAESSRFTHSLGVLQLARRALAQLCRQQPDLSSHQGVLFAAALLHDVGHAPLSHSGEDMFGLRHEHWSARLVREHPALRDRLEQFQPGSAMAVAELLEHGQHCCPAVAALVSGQLDCDRLDYLLRDSHSTGTCYGQLDLERILAALTIAPDGSLAIHPKGLMAVEHYLVVRDLMYRSVYNHRLNVVCNWLLNQAITLARALGPSQVFADAVMARWLWRPDAIDLTSFLANDDVRTGYHLMRWKEEGPEALATVSRRILERQLLKALDVSRLDQGQQLELLARAQRLSSEAGLDSGLCCALHQRQSQGYHPYKGGLRLWDGESLRALEASSSLVASLTQPVALAWLIHPAEVGTALKQAEHSLRTEPRQPAD